VHRAAACLFLGGTPGRVAFEGAELESVVAYQLVPLRASASVAARNVHA
jgi:hypothetical protein